MDGKHQLVDSEELEPTSPSSHGYSESDLLAVLSTIREDVGEEQWSESWVSVSGEELSTVSSLTRILDAAEKAMDAYFDSKRKINNQVKQSESEQSATDPPPETSRDDLAAEPEDEEEELRELPMFDSMTSELSTGIASLRMIKTLKISEEPCELVSTSQVDMDKALDELVPKSSSVSEDDAAPSVTTVRSWYSAPPALSHTSSTCSYRRPRNSETVRASLTKLALQRKLPPPLEIPTATRGKAATGPTTTSGNKNNALDPVAEQQWKERIGGIKYRLRQRMLEQMAAQEKMEQEGAIALETSSEDHEDLHMSSCQTKKPDTESNRTSMDSVSGAAEEVEDDIVNDDSTLKVNPETVSADSYAHSNVSLLCTTSHDQSSSTTPPRTTSGDREKFGNPSSQQNIPLPDLLVTPMVRSFSSTEEDAILIRVTSSGSSGRMVGGNSSRSTDSIPILERNTEAAVETTMPSAPPPPMSSTIDKQQRGSIRKTMASLFPGPLLKTLKRMDQGQQNDNANAGKTDKNNMNLMGVMVWESEDGDTTPRTNLHRSDHNDHDDYQSRKLIDAILTVDNEESVETAFIDIAVIQQKADAALLATATTPTVATTNKRFFPWRRLRLPKK